MAKASDILNKSGAGGPMPGSSGSQIPLTPGAKKATKSEGESAAAQKPDRGHTSHHSGKAQGGGGGSSARPKV